jgi:hypothetical protein
MLAYIKKRVMVNLACFPKQLYAYRVFAFLADDVVLLFRSSDSNALPYRTSDHGEDVALPDSVGHR